jgi:hypothetical protein
MGADKPKAGVGEELMVMKEESSCLQRIFCRNNRAFRIGIAPTSRAVATYIPGMDSRRAIFAHPVSSLSIFSYVYISYDVMVLSVVAGRHDRGSPL